MNKARLFVLGIPVDLAENYLERIKHLKGGHIVTLNTEMVMLAKQNPDLANIINQADLIVPDGSGVVIYGQFQGFSLQRCPGIDLAGEVLNYANDHCLKVFFVGASPEIAGKNLYYWEQKFPHLPIVGSHHGYFDQTGEEKIIAAIRQTQPHFIFVALGVPKQELWINQHRSVCPQGIWMGVGGSFDVWAGAKRRAPAWIGKIHLEWFYRLLQEPWRWRRMLVFPQFVGQVIWEFFNQKPNRK